MQRCRDAEKTINKKLLFTRMKGIKGIYTFKQTIFFIPFIPDRCFFKEAGWLLGVGLRLQ
jgi:hypothetical protein